MKVCLSYQVLIVARCRAIFVIVHMFWFLADVKVREPSVSTVLMNFENKFDPYCSMSVPLYQTATFKQVTSESCLILMIMMCFKCKSILWCVLNVRVFVCYFIIRLQLWGLSIYNKHIILLCSILGFAFVSNVRSIVHRGSLVHTNACSSLLLPLCVCVCQVHCLAAC